MLNAYLADTRLYLTPEEIASLKDALRYQQSAQRTLDLSELPSDLSDWSHLNHSGTLMLLPLIYCLLTK